VLCTVAAANEADHQLLITIRAGAVVPHIKHAARDSTLNQGRKTPNVDCSCKISVTS
jgi:hypothetical protein